MRTVITYGRWLGLLLVLACFTGNAYAQRNVTLRLNTATIPDTTRSDSFVEVRGAVNGVAPITLIDGNMIDWSDVSTLEPQNIGGDYWQITFQIADTTDLTFKFFSQQADDANLDGWEADPNPNIPPGAGDTTLVTHFFEPTAEYRGASGDRGDYDWRPFESKEDSVGIWFRVAFFGQETVDDAYDPAAEAPAQQIGVRGDNLDINGDQSVLGPVDWGSTNVVLSRESTIDNAPGYNIYSGVAYYPRDLVGRTQPYKFVLDNDILDDDNLGWEEGNVPPENRRFVVPPNDSTLHWVYYGDTAPTTVEPEEPVTSNLIFDVDLSAFEAIGLFRRARGDTLWVFGEFNGWQNCPDTNPDDCLMIREPGEDIFSAAVPTARIPGVELDYKYFLDFNDEEFMNEFGVEPPSGWEEGHRTGIDRRFTFEGSDEQLIGLEFFNDVTPQNLIPEGVSIDVMFTVDMTPALNNAAQPFDPAGGDSVFIEISDPIWAFTQGALDTDADFPVVGGFLLDDDGDNVYAGVFTVEGPTYSNLTFKYGYGQGGSLFIEEGGSTKPPPGRRRSHFIVPNADGSWPAAYSLPAHEFQPAGNLPFENNPALATGIEVIDDEVPDNVWLGENYPNPFNPSTTFEYSIDRTQFVTIRVYDMLGRVVATLVDGAQQAAVYQVSFDASKLASGVYFYRLETQSKVLSKRMLLIK